MGKNKWVKSLEQRFLEKIEKTDNCWNWLAYLNEWGYGVFSENRKTILAHRFSWKFYKGEIPKGLEVCDRCDNPKCVNPDHLWLGTHIENVEDTVRKGRNVSFKGEANGASKLTQKQVNEIRDMSKKYSSIEIAKIYSITREHVWGIVKYRVWKD